ncbi:unnamed protein product [Spodoptera exigua]|nr:unnamed protein product [Spodoptera exigua]
MDSRNIKGVVVECVAGHLRIGKGRRRAWYWATENITEPAIVPICNDNPTEDEPPPLSPSLLTEELQLSLQTTVEQQALNDSPAPIIEQVNVHEPEETINTPPRLGSIGVYKDISPRPSTSAQVTNDRIAFTPEAVRPLPKAPPRKCNKRRKTRKSTIYTDKPEKEEIRKEHEVKLKRATAKQVKKRLDGRKGKKEISKGKKRNTKQELSSEASEEEECYCIVYLAPYSESRSGGKWIQCTSCKQWAHEECTEGGLSYVCHNSDSEYSD